MRIDIITLFPAMCTGPLGESIAGRAQQKGLLQLHVHDLRDYSEDKHRRVDDVPYGGGPGMILKPEPLAAAVEAVKKSAPDSKVILLTPQGRRLEQGMVRDFAAENRNLILVCGHYEGVDHRFIERYVDEELSIGDYILTNGAIAAVILSDAILRLLPGVLGDERSPEEESFSADRLEAPHYTRPAIFQGLEVPPVLLSGHHAEIEKWRKDEGEARTRENRPDLL